MLGQIYLSMIECTKYVLFCHKGLCYRRATVGTFVLDLLSVSLQKLIKVSTSLIIASYHIRSKLKPSIQK